MNNLSMLANIAEIIGVIIVVGGLFFAVLQMRQLRQQRRELAAMELFRSFGNPEFAHAYNRILQLPTDLTATDIREGENDLEDAAMLIGTTMENIGVMTFQRIVPFKVVRNLVGASTIILWQKLEPWTMDLRARLDSEEAFEWFQWLAERLQEQKLSGEPAYLAEKDWQPMSAQQEL